MVTGVHYISTRRWSSPWPSLTLKTNTAFIALLPLSHDHPPHTLLTTASDLSPLRRDAYPLLKSHQHSFPTVMLSAPIFVYPILHPKLGPSSSYLCPEHQKVLDGLGRTQGSQGVCPLPPRKWPPGLSTMQMHFPVGNKGPEAQLPSFPAFGLGEGGALDRGGCSWAGRWYRGFLGEKSAAC